MLWNLGQYKGTALIDTNGGSETYEGLVSFCNKVKNLNLKRDVAFILAGNNVETISAFLALCNNRVVPLLLNAELDVDLLHTYVQTYQPRYVCVPQTKADLFGETETIFSFGGYVLLELINVEREDVKLYDELAFLLSTSGTTGSPKLVRHSYKNLEASARNVARALKLTDRERALANLPSYFTQGLNVILSNLTVGAVVLLCDLSLTSKEFWSFLKDQRATSITGVPFSYEVMVRLGFLKMDLPDLKIINEGGGRLNDRIFKGIAQYAVDNGKLFIPTYGSTETTSRMCFMDPSLSVRKTGSIGSPIPPGYIKLMDDDGNEVTESGQKGEIVYYGPNVTLGYAFSRADLSKGDERNGHYATGDIAYFDGDGCYFIVGRKGRFVKVYGYRISLDELEKLLKDHFMAVFACTGSDKQIYIFSESCFDDKEVIGYISDKLHLLPNIFKYRQIDKFPRNSYGKVLFAKLKEMENS